MLFTVPIGLCSLGASLVLSTIISDVRLNNTNMGFGVPIDGEAVAAGSCWPFVQFRHFEYRIRLAYQTVYTEHVKLLSQCFTGRSTPTGHHDTSDGRLNAI